jgi:small subunit ribosomal protein S20
VPNIKSAQKRVQIAERNRQRNKAYNSAVKTLIKTYYAAVETHVAEPSEGNKQVAQAAMSAAYSKIDKAVKRGALHRNTGARRKARLAKAWKQVEPVQ